LKSAFEKKYPFINMEFYSSGKDALLAAIVSKRATGTYPCRRLSVERLPIMNLVEKGLWQVLFAGAGRIYNALRDKDGY